MTQTQPVFQVDSFADNPFCGNPAAVCVLQDPRDEVWMQNVAREMNLSETAFVERRDDAWGLRWFTPTTEVDLCGHATLATAHVLWEEEYVPPNEQCRFQTRSGILTADRVPMGIELDFPSLPSKPVAPHPDLAAAVGLEPSGVFLAGSADEPTWLIEIADEGLLRGVRPDFPRLSRIAPGSAIVTAKSNAPGCDFVSRFFAPAIGVDEDPVTGWAHCILAPFWGERLGKEEMVGYQASPRGGVVGVRLAADRVKLRGRAVTVLRGELMA